jgi:isopentenyldiphosphate isomerase
MDLYEQRWKDFLEEEKENKDSKEIAKAVLYKEDKVLLLKRSSYMKKHAREWDLPGGHIIEGEDMEDGLLREVWEETGLKIKSPTKLHSNGNDTYYKAELPDQKVELSDEHTEYDMFSLEDLDNLNLPDKYAKAVKETLS